MNFDMNKKLHGQFFTINNPFSDNAFFEWFNAIPNELKQNIIEPFCGSNNIVEMINSLNLCYPNWYCYDIVKNSYNCTPENQINIRDTIKNFPKEINAEIIITNPPYLAKNSASRSGLSFLYPEYDDLYKKCLEVMLKNSKYVAAIIPESFITANIFIDRLDRVISLNCRMFDDTECPVCLAMFSNKVSEDFEIFRQGNPKRIGTYKELEPNIVKSDFNKKEWKFNDPLGEIGLIAIDNTRSPSIEFVDGCLVDSVKIKSSSRSITRISGLPKNINLDKFIKECNIILNNYRKDTKDVFLTAFKGLRSDGYYRRRIDFDTAKNIMGKALEKLL